MPTYRVKPGYRHGARKQHGPGDTVELSAAEAAGFLDKLELVAGAEAEKQHGYLWTSTPQIPVEAQGAPSSFARFEGMTATEIIAKAQALTADERAALAAWERAGKARKTVLEALERAE